jgi:hypothetical protein
MKNPYLTKSSYIDNLRCEKKLWLRWHERLPQVVAHLPEFFTVLDLDSAPEVYAAKSLCSKPWRCDYFDSCMVAKPGGWLGATGVSLHTLIARRVLGQADAMQPPGAKTGLVFNMGGLGVASYANVIEGVFA